MEQAPNQHCKAILLGQAKGLTAIQLAHELGLSSTTVRSIAKSIGIRLPRPTHWRLKRIDGDQLQSLLDSGLTQLEAGERLGVSVNTIERRVRQMGLKTARTGPRLGRGHTHSWAGGRRIGKLDYVEIYAPLHPSARTLSGSVSEHRLMMEVVLGRYLGQSEVVHHLDDNPQNNNPENLRLFATNADHLRHELTGRKKSSPRKPAPDDLRCSQTTPRCPSEPETLCGTPSEIRDRLAAHIEIHRPTREQESLRLRDILRSGPDRQPFQWASKG